MYYNRPNYARISITIILSNHNVSYKFQILLVNYVGIPIDKSPITF